MNRQMLEHSLLLFIGLLWVASASPAQADAFLDQLNQLAAQQRIVVPLADWKFQQSITEDGAAINVDDSNWQTVATGFEWQGEHSQVWFRTRYVVPAQIGGVSTEGDALRLEVGIDDEGQFYLDGKPADRFLWDDGHLVLAAHAHPGQVFNIALRGLNTVGPHGGLRKAQVVYDALGSVQPAWGRYQRDLQFVQGVASQGAAPQQQQVRAVIQRSEAQVNLAALRAHDWQQAGSALTLAQQTLTTLAPLTRQYDLYYIGHSHIDMNWLWPWPETIDTCHRTWDSAMKLMDMFPDFGFVQSQPGAYVPIQQMYPEEFRRMQQTQQRGQWDLVGGLWDESDTNMPSGEALARSLFLGQRYFKANFGRYATTGWLPDSFGHSWQLPQLMQGVGIQNFYHMRGGDNLRFSWWQSPDGSRVLKAKTDNSYDEPIIPDQLLRPWQTEKSLGLKQDVVIFGVGDHGGGPTRDMILDGKEFQSNPLLPRVHFLTADAYFQRLRSEAQLAALPVVDTDLQYVAVGCYTTHADMKKAVRQSENNLYADEVFSSLAAMAGQPYPVAAFEEAWKPTVFAQFHDIMCGSAIHSTYDWMHEQLAPAFAFEHDQGDKSLAALTASVDTTGVAANGGAAERPVVVWNALSFPRSDVVRLTVDDASQFAAVRDAQGTLLPLQALDAHTLVFVARDVPGFGHKTYFLGNSASAAPHSNAPHQVTAQESAERIVLENEFMRASITRSTGLITSLLDKKTGQEMIKPGEAGNLLQVLGDKANAWDLDFTGEQHPLNAGAQVQLVARGPVCAIVRVQHSFNKSTFSQDITLWNDLPRLDLPTTVEWHEHGQTLKALLPLNMAHPAARAGIPYGSIERPISGQEYPGQKWMDVTEQEIHPVQTGTPLLLDALFNSQSTGDFDTEKRGYDPAALPPPGLYHLGATHIPFRLPSHTGPDNIACNDQVIQLPPDSRGKTLYLLGAAAPGDQGGLFSVEDTKGHLARLPIHMNDWVVGGSLHNEAAFTFERQHTADGLRAMTTHFWITSIQLPNDQRPVRLRLPYNTNLHLFAATLAAASPTTPRYGLTILNDCKYGADTQGNRFRLTLLRSSSDPDPNPDEGTQVFTYSLLPHAGDWRLAQSEQAGLALNIPLRGIVTDSHRGQTVPLPTFTLEPTSNVIAGALKHCEDSPGYILRLFETQGRNTTAQLRFSQPVRVEETDILERPLAKRRLRVQGRTVTLPIGHDQIVTLHIVGLPDNWSPLTASSPIKPVSLP